MHKNVKDMILAILYSTLVLWLNVAIDRVIFAL